MSGARILFFWVTWLGCLLGFSGHAQFRQLMQQPAAPALHHAPGPVQAGGQAPGQATPWVVYSDRDNNPTYRKANLGAGFKKLRFREAFYVLNERNGFLELIRYDAALKIGAFYARRHVQNQKQAVYVGWAPKDQLVLTSQAPHDSASTLPTLYCPALTSSELLRNTGRYLRHDSLLLYARPDMNSALRTKLKLYDLVYVYKFSADGGAALLGSADWFTADSAATGLLGWAPTRALQPVGQGMFLEADTVHATPGQAPIYDTPAQVYKPLGAPVALQSFATVPWGGARLPLLQQCPRPSAPVWQLGLLTPLLETDNFILNVDGQPVTRQKIAGWRSRSKVYNIVFVLENGPAMRPHWNDLVNAVQSIISQFSSSPQPGEYRVGVVLYHQDFSPAKGSTSLSRYLSTQPLTRDAALVIDQLSKHKPTSGAAPSVNQPVGTGVGRALELLKDHPAENNLVILVGINGDAYPVAQQPALRTALRKTEARLLAFQAAAPTDTLANNFVLQAQQLVRQSALEGAKTKRQRLVSSALVIPTPAYDLRLGAQNVYRLNFPTQSMVPGWVMFPAKKKRLPLSLLVAATDSLMQQQRLDVNQVQASLSQAFGAMMPLRSHISPQVNRTLTARLEPPVSALPPALFALRSYPFYRQAYANFSPDSTTFRQLRLVTADTYEALGYWLNLLAADGLDPYHRPDLRAMGQRYQQLAQYGHRAVAPTTTLRQALTQLVGLPARHALLGELRLADLAQPERLPPDTWAKLLYLLRERRDFYLRLPTFPNSRFTSNGHTYYWISEDLFR